MKFTEYKGTLKHGSYAPCKNQRRLQEFMDMEIKVAHVELEDGEYASLNSAQSTLCQSIKTFKFPISVHIVKGELYLIRKDM